jgi:uncharacterized RDD family membrane protein YckC
MKSQPPPEGAVSAQGNYAGSASRFLAYAVDLGASTVVFTLALAGVAFVIQVVTSHKVTWTQSDPLVAALFVAWQFFYFGYSWAVASRSFGMYVLGLRVVRADGTEIVPRQGVLRALVFPLSFLLLGLGFLGILVQHEHRALHDLIAGTTVVYAWDARAARLRFLASAAEIGARGRPQAASTSGGAASGGAASGGAAADRDRAAAAGQAAGLPSEAPGGAALDGQAQPAGDAPVPGNGPGQPRP